MPTIRPISQPPTYAEVIAAESYGHEPVFVVLTPVRRTEDPPRKDPPVHDISAGDRFVALLDIGIRKAVSKVLPNSNNKKGEGSSKS